MEFFRSKLLDPLVCRIEGEIGVDLRGISKHFLCVLLDGYELQMEKLDGESAAGSQEPYIRNRLLAVGIFAGILIFCIRLFSV